MVASLRFLRPYTIRPLATANSSRCSAYSSFYELASTGVASCFRRGQSTHAVGISATEEYTAEERSALVANRIARLKQAGSLRYPRVTHKNKRVTVHDFWDAYHGKNEETLSTISSCVTVTGMLKIVAEDVDPHGN